MPVFFRLGALIALLLASLAPRAAQAADRIELEFGVYTSDKPSVMFLMFRPALDALEEQIEKTTGQPVSIDLRIIDSYDDAITALARGEVDFARFGPASYVLAEREDSGIELLVMERTKTGKTFDGVIVVRSASDIAEVESLRGKRFAFGNENSTVGRYRSQALLAERGIMRDDLARADYLGRHA